jgi:hypothetical protein
VWLLAIKFDGLSEDIRPDSVASNGSPGQMNFRQLCYPHKVRLFRRIVASLGKVTGRNVSWSGCRESCSAFEECVAGRSIDRCSRLEIALIW